MNNDKLKFVVDSRSFDGSCVTTMTEYTATTIMRHWRN